MSSGPLPSRWSHANVQLCIIVATNHDWFGRQHFYQLFAADLARLGPVLYVSGPKNADQAAQSGVVQRGSLRRGTLVSALPQVLVLVPELFRGAHWRSLLWFRERVLGAQVRAAMRTVGVDASGCLVISFVPERLRLGRRSDRVRCSAYWTGDEVVDPREDWLLRRSDLVLAVSEQATVQKRTRTAAPVIRIGMGIDPQPFIDARRRQKCPSEMVALARPIIGYGGGVSGRIDWDIVEHLAKASIGTVVFVGPVLDAEAHYHSSRLKEVGVIFLGHRDLDCAPDYLAAFDVGIIPYTRSKFNLGANPVKMYEYLASGLPIVSTALPEVERLGALVHIAHDSASFVQAVRQALDANHEGAIIARQTASANMSIEKIVDRIFVEVLSICEPRE